MIYSVDENVEMEMRIIDERINNALGYNQRKRRDVDASDRTVVMIADQRRPYVPIVEVRGKLEDNLSTIEEKLGLAPQRKRR
jgi:hypothetical protein